MRRETKERATTTIVDDTSLILFIHDINNFGHCAFQCLFFSLENHIHQSEAYV